MALDLNEVFIHCINEFIEYLIVHKVHCQLCLMRRLILYECKSFTSFTFFVFWNTHMLDLPSPSKNQSKLIMRKTRWKIFNVNHRFVNLSLIYFICFKWNSSLDLAIITWKLKHLRRFQCFLCQLKLFRFFSKPASMQNTFDTIEIQKYRKIKLSRVFKLPLEIVIFGKIGITKVKLYLIQKLSDDFLFRWLHFSLQLITFHSLIFTGLNTHHLSFVVSNKIWVRVHDFTKLLLLVFVISFSLPQGLLDTNLLLHFSIFFDLLLWAIFRRHFP